MNPLEKRAIGFLLLGGITVLGIYWQYRLMARDTKQFKDVRSYKSINKAPSRLRIGGWLCFILIVGIVAHGVIAIHVDKQPLTYSQILSEVSKTAWFAVIFLTKSFFGPVITMSGAAIAAYYYLNYGTIANLPIITSIMEFAASFAPDWLENVYTLLYSGYAIVTSLYDTVADV